jgi:hypothetical protein
MDLGLEMAITVGIQDDPQLTSTATAAEATEQAFRVALGTAPGTVPEAVRRTSIQTNHILDKKLLSNDLRRNPLARSRPQSSQSGCTVLWLGKTGGELRRPQTMSA